jgi:hypothetical protein
MILISLGSQCHPAYWIKQSKINPISYPFDWLYTPPWLGLDYVVQNINNNFSLWLADLERVDGGWRNNIVSKHYPYTVFPHYKRILSDPSVKEMLERRAKRFIETIKDSNKEITFVYVYFLYKDSILPDHLNCFKDSVNEFLELVPTSKLIIYFADIHRSSNFCWNDDSTWHPRVETFNYIRNKTNEWLPLPEFFNNFIYKQDA